ncbi:patatin-like phospholipase family protein [Aurantiacibacter xanthus]|uniref:Patatin-like phospholipase family protein n=1 Tax=Aurantiacibacter xanthus TaxID=1784712 RepID=A0A3A1P5E7_9SPHN|nr:patatin-like phospholipase family protein [Aurantiacibacter xanthus]RIV88665.1 patatin-like phospholipase family protein [Aurantiacibacter xanthus]
MSSSRSRSSAPPQVLVLQGGGALGAYQAGVFESLHAEGHHPDWVAGISIGAINSALIAGNRPDEAVGKLRAFWDLVSSELTAIAPADSGPARRWFNEVSAALVASVGAPGFFRPRLPGFTAPAALFTATSIYDTSPLRETLTELVDFDLLNDGPMRFSVGAVNVITGNLTWFDNRQCRIGPEHIMASGALPPGFPPVEVDGQFYWDGGLVSNTPLQYVIDEEEGTDMTIYQVDLFHTRGAVPEDLADVMQREKDIRFSSRTRLNTDLLQQIKELRVTANRLAKKLPDEWAKDPDLVELTRHPDPGAVAIMHLINRRELYETFSKDYEFSRATVNEHWRTGAEDARISLEHPCWTGRNRHRQGLITYDLRNPDGPRVRDALGTELANARKGAPTP